MRCDLAQVEVSARMDGEHIDPRTAEAIDEHVGGCARCQAFATSSARVRASVRIRAAEPVPDLVARIVDELHAIERPAVAPTLARRTRRAGSRRAVSVVAALVAGAVIGSVLVGGPFRGRDQQAISATAVVRGVREASPGIGSFQGTYDVVERGLSPEVPMRRLEVHLAFLAPQRFRLDVTDRTTYPSAAFVPTDVTYIQDLAETYGSGPTGCPADLADDICPIARTTVTSGAPFADLMMPIHTLGSTDGVRVLGIEDLADHETVTLELTFARAAPLFPFLTPSEAWRPFFKGDRVELALDAESWLPRHISVFPAATEERRAWELRFGRAAEDPSVPILEVEVTSSSTEPPDASLFDIPGSSAPVLSVIELAERIGYRPATPTFTGDLELAAAIAPSAGPRAPRSVLVYSGGLDYVRIGERPAGSASSTFGALGPRSVPIILPGGEVAAYAPAVGARGRRLTIRGRDTSLFLESNLPKRELIAIAASIPLRGGSPA
jgi:anti-sigma factor RsiW